ncbi:hypothetical protein [Planomonospora algeriensis]
MRHRDRRRAPPRGTLRVWVHGGAAAEPARRAPATFPVSVTGGTASAQVRLVPPLPGRTDLTAVDGRTGRPIACVRPARLPDGRAAPAGSPPLAASPGRRAAFGAV